MLGHSGDDPKREELEADNLAINCVLQLYREYCGGDDLLSCFAAAGAMVVLYFLEVLHTFYGGGASVTHPPPVFRRAALSMAIFGSLSKAVELNYQGIIQITHTLFASSITPSQLTRDPDLSRDLNKSQLAVIPLDQPPCALVLDRK